MGVEVFSYVCSSDRLSSAFSKISIEALDFLLGVL